MKIDPHIFLKETLKADETLHNKKTLYDHLSKVEKILRLCDFEEEVCLAGLFHSVYGTSVFKTKSTKDRSAVKEIIGVKAEKLVYIFSIVKRPFCWEFGHHLPLINGSFIFVDLKTLKQLQCIEAANLLEQKLAGMTDFLYILKFVYSNSISSNTEKATIP